MKRFIICLLAGILLSTLAPYSGETQDWQYKAVLLTDASRDESTLWIRMEASIEVDRLVLIESRDGQVQATYMVRHVFDDHIILETNLEEDWVAGSRVLQ